MKIYYEKTDRSIGILEGERRFVSLYHPFTLMGRFLPRALQPAAVGGRGGTSNPISLSLQELTLLRRLNPSYAQWRWLFGIGPGWPYRIPEEELARLADIGITEEQWVYANRTRWLDLDRYGVLRIESQAVTVGTGVILDEAQWCK